MAEESLSKTQISMWDFIFATKFTQYKINGGELEVVSHSYTVTESSQSGIVSLLPKLSRVVQKY